MQESVSRIEDCVPYDSTLEESKVIEVDLSGVTNRIVSRIRADYRNNNNINNDNNNNMNTNTNKKQKKNQNSVDSLS